MASMAIDVTCYWGCNWNDVKFAAAYVERVSTSDYNWRRELRVRDQRFIDQVQYNAYGGRSGQGLPKMGGVGGDGGDVYLVADAAKRHVSYSNRFLL